MDGLIAAYLPTNNAVGIDFVGCCGCAHSQSHPIFGGAHLQADQAQISPLSCCCCHHQLHIQMNRFFFAAFVAAADAFDNKRRQKERETRSSINQPEICSWLRSIHICMHFVVHPRRIDIIVVDGGHNAEIVCAGQ